MTIPVIEKPPARPRRRAEKPPAKEAARIQPGRPDAGGPRPREERAAEGTAASAYRVVMVCGFYAGNE